MSRPARILGLVALLAFLMSGLLWAELYRVKVTRKAQNLYRVEDAVGDVYIKTRWCYAYAYREDAIVDSDEMVIHFLDSDDECDIEKFLVG